MKALILNGAPKGGATLAPVVEALCSELTRAGYEPTTLTLADIDISSCRGDFGCWIKTPGECVINDAARDIACAIVQSDVLILLTPVTFGGYSSELKKALDRAISIIRPEFQMIHGEIHHKRRYRKYPALFAIGVTAQLDADAAGMFADMVRRNALNFHSPWHATVVLLADAALDEVRTRIRQALAQVEVVR